MPPNYKTPAHFARASADLVALICACGRPKPRRQTFCEDCFSILPSWRRLIIYASGGDYSQNYFDSIAYLAIALAETQPEVAARLEERLSDP